MRGLAKKKRQCFVRTGKEIIVAKGNDENGTGFISIKLLDLIPGALSPGPFGSQIIHPEPGFSVVK